MVDNDVNDAEVRWTKRGIFCDLPYWEHNTLRHNLKCYAYREECVW